VTALRESSSWDSSAFLITYDEHGGYFEHVPPPQIDAFGLGIRVPMWVISPHARKGRLEPAVIEHTSTLKLIETLHGLPTLASVTHLFDAATPAGSNYEAAAPGASVGPPAPTPRRPRPDRRPPELLCVLTLRPVTRPRQPGVVELPRSGGYLPAAARSSALRARLAAW
jgi:phospholipase C